MDVLIFVMFFCCFVCCLFVVLGFVVYICSFQGFLGFRRLNQIFDAPRKLSLLIVRINIKICTTTPSTTTKIVSKYYVMLVSLELSTTI